MTTAASFHRPDWNAPLDLAATVATIPENAMVKGMFFHAPIAMAKAISGKTPGRGKYIAFKDYTVREHVEVLSACANIAFAGQPPREALRRLGQSAFGEFAQSLAGKAIFGVAARDFAALIRLVGRAYDVVGNTSKAEVVELEDNYTVLHLTGVYNLPDTYHVGVFEGAMRDYGKQGEVLIRPMALGDVMFRVEWR